MGIEIDLLNKRIKQYEDDIKMIKETISESKKDSAIPWG